MISSNLCPLIDSSRQKLRVDTIEQICFTILAGKKGGRSNEK